MTGLELGRGGRDGFTLIEVMGALVIFALGILIAVQLAGTLSLQVESTALRAGVVSRTQERLEELDRRPYDSLTFGTEVDTLTIRGRRFVRTTAVTDFDTRVIAVEVSVEPVQSEEGPSHSLTSYVFGAW